MKYVKLMLARLGPRQDDHTFAKDVCRCVAIYWGVCYDPRGILFKLAQNIVWTNGHT